MQIYWRRILGTISLRRTVPLCAVGLANAALLRSPGHGPTPVLLALALAFLAGLATGSRSWFSVLVLMIPLPVFGFLNSNGLPWLVIWSLDLWGFVLMGRALRRDIERRVGRSWL